MKLKYNFVTNQVADKIVAVAVGDDLSKFNGFIKMDGIGAFIFNQLKNDVTEDDIVDSMKKEYIDNSEEEIRTCVKEFVEQLKGSDIIIDG